MGRRPTSNRKHSGNATPFGRKSSVAHGIDATMDTVQPSCECAGPSRVIGDAKVSELRGRHHPVLSFGHLGDLLVDWDDFYVHLTDKSSQATSLPPARAVLR